MKKFSLREKPILYLRFVLKFDYIIRFNSIFTSLTRPNQDIIWFFTDSSHLYRSKMLAVSV